MADTFRDLCAEPLAQEAYVAFVQICKGGSDDAGTYDADEAIVRRALKRLDELEGALLAQPEPEGLTEQELWQIWDGPYTTIPDILRAAIAADRARRPTPQPPADAEVRE